MTDPEMEIREHLRATRRCFPPHGSLDDLLFGDATITEHTDRQRPEADPLTVPEDPEPGPPPANRLSTAPRLVAPVLAALVLVLALLAVYAVGWRTQ